MNRKFLILTSFIFLSFVLFGGGIVTNTNQSASWVRMPSRNASLDIDATYFNPAGLTSLKDGFHISLNYQCVFQDKDIETTYQYLNESTFKYEGDVFVPFFPSFYGVWKKNKLAVSFGFNPVGGGGGAVYKDGLGSFETNIANIVPMLQSSLAPLDAGIAALTGNNPGFANIDGYQADINFEGTSIYLGYQMGVSYKLFDMLSVFAGARYITAKNTYDGYMRNILINAPTSYGGSQTAGNYLRLVAGTPGLDASTVATLTGRASYLDVATANVEVDVEQKGTGITPLIGVNLSFSERLNIGIKYEFITKIELETTVHDEKGGGIFVQDSVVRCDLPGMLSLGVGFKALPKLNTAFSFNYYQDRSANYGRTVEGVQVDNDDVIDNNYFEVALGFEYNLSEKLMLSLGWLLAKTGVSKEYQNDMSYSLTSNSIGGGVKYSLNEKLNINISAFNSFYNQQKVDYSVDLSGNSIPAQNNYIKTNLIFSLGVDYNF